MKPRSSLEDRTVTRILGGGWRRRVAVLTTAVMTAFGGVVVSAATTPTPAGADITEPTTTTSYSYTTPGVYSLTVPNTILPDLGDIHIHALGGAGNPGSASSGGVNLGGAGGSGTDASLSAQSSELLPGDRLQIVVGAKGGAAPGGHGTGLAGDGGSGGGASYVLDLDRSAGQLILVAGGGGGGGGAGASLVGVNGGGGGTEGPGGDTSGVFNTAHGGALGVSGTCGTSNLSFGTAGSDAGTGTASGGGGGGGGGACGGLGGEDGGASGIGGAGGGSGASFGFHTAAFDAGTNTGDGSVTVDLTTYVPTAPRITSPTCNIRPVNTPFVVLADATAYPPPLWGANNLPAGFQLNEFDGSVGSASGVPVGQYQYQLFAQNSIAIDVKTITVAVGSDSPAILSSPSATATVGTPFDFTVQYVGCPPASSWRIVSGQLPPGLALRGDGHIVGTPGPGTAGTYPVTVAAQPSDGSAEISQHFTLTVNTALAVTTTSLPPAYAGIPYTATLAASGGGGAPTWTLTGGSTLPAGLTFGSDGTISGTPTAAGTTTFTVHAVDSTDASNHADAALSITVNPQPPLSYTSRYTSSEAGLLSVAETYLHDTDLATTQHEGALFLAYLGALVRGAGLTAPAFGSAPGTGPLSVTTTYTPAELASLLPAAAFFSTDVATLQRTGVLLIGYLVKVSGTH